MSQTITTVLHCAQHSHPPIQPSSHHTAPHEQPTHITTKHNQNQQPQQTTTNPPDFPTLPLSFPTHSLSFPILTHNLNTPAPNHAPTMPTLAIHTSLSHPHSPVSETLHAQTPVIQQKYPELVYQTEVQFKTETQQQHQQEPQRCHAADSQKAPTPHP